jgi:hypothetical protein
VNSNARLALTRRALALWTVTASAAACGGSQNAPAPPGTGGSGDAVTITGRESIGWDQEAASLSEAHGLRYALYVDESAVELSGVLCRSSMAQVFACQARLPALSPGSHRLQLTALRVNSNGAYSESGRSTAITVLVSPALGSASAPISSRSDESAAAGCAALAVGPPPLRPLVADPTGIRRQRPDDPSGGILLLEDAEPESPVLGMALHPAFGVTRLVYVLRRTGSKNEGYRLQLLRFRDVGDTLGERAVLLDRPIAFHYVFGRLRFDGTGYLYAGVWGAVEDSTEGAGTVDAPGLLLRLTEEGRSPDDSPDRSGRVVDAEPIGGFDVENGTGRVWVLQQWGGKHFSLRTLALNRAQRSEIVPLDSAPAQIAVRASSPRDPVGQLWAAFRDAPPEVITRGPDGVLAPAGSTGSAYAAVDDVAFGSTGVLFGCAAGDASSGLPSQVLRLEPPARSPRMTR